MNLHWNNWYLIIDTTDLALATGRFNIPESCVFPMLIDLPNPSNSPADRVDTWHALKTTQEPLHLTQIRNNSLTIYIPNAC